MLKNRFFNFLKWFTIISIDFFIFMGLSISLMSYDDNYNESKGEYWSLTSMNLPEKTIYIWYNIYILVNIIGFFFILRNIYRKKTT